MISIEYEVENAGWATVTFGNGVAQERFGVSYLHDSLKELAVSAIKIKDKNYQSVVFMEEPGEIKLVLQLQQDSKLSFDLRWYKDWASWNLISEDAYEVIMIGETTVTTYINEVRNILLKIHNEIGPQLYKEKWIEHEFPMEEYEKLK